MSLARQGVPSYECPRCGFVSHHPKDAEERYCVRSHQFENTPLLSKTLTVKWLDARREPQ